MKHAFHFVARVFVSAAFLVSLTPAIAASDDAVSVAIPHEKNKNTDWYLYAGPGLVMAKGNTGWAVNFGGLTQAVANTGLFWGVDLGIDFWSASAAFMGTKTSSSATAFQLLPTAIYRFEISGAPLIHPYVGLSFGPNIYIERASIGGTQGDSNTTLYLETLLRPGIFLNLGEAMALNVEAKFGLLGTGFAFLPQVNAYFAM